MKVRKIKDPIYNRDITLIYECDKEEFLQYVEKRHKNLKLERYFIYAAHIGISSETTWVRHYIWSREGRGVEYCGVINHEVFHCARDCFKEIGMEINEETNEAFAYYQEYIFEQVLKALLVKKKEIVIGE
jgi:hypothetical protein